jgi:Cu/Ag efflux protein CusF
MNPSSCSLRRNIAVAAKTLRAALTSRRLLALLFVATLPLLLFPSGCGTKEEKHYPIQAEVIAVDMPHKLILVKHGEISGLMPAMTMSYVIAVPKQAEGLGPGDKITADLVVSNNHGRLEKIALLERAKPASRPTPRAAP